MVLPPGPARKAPARPKPIVSILFVPGGLHNKSRREHEGRAADQARPNQPFVYSLRLNAPPFHVSPPELLAAPVSALASPLPKEGTRVRYERRG